MRWFFLALLFVCVVPSLWAQGRADSLAERLAETTGAERVAVLAEIVEATYRYEPAGAFRAGAEALQLLEHHPDSNRQRQVRLNMGRAYYHTEQYDSLHVYVERLMNEGSPQAAAHADQLRGYALHGQGQYDAAQAILLTARERYEGLRDPRGLADVNLMLGVTSRDQNDYDAALDFFAQALRGYEQIGDPSHTAYALFNIGIIHRRQSNHETALDYYLQALRIGEALGERHSMARSLNNIGSVYRSLGNYDAALEALNRARAIREEIGDRQGLTVTLNSMGLVYEAQGDYDAALTAFTQSLEEKEALGDRRGMAVPLSNMGDIYRDQGDLVAARSATERSLAITEELGDARGIAIALNNLGLIAQEQGQLDEALAHFTRSLVLKEEMGYAEGAVNSLLNIGSIHQLRGDWEEAEAFFTRSLTMNEAMGDAEGIVIALTSLGRVHQEAGDLEEAANLTTRAVVLADSIRVLPKLRNAYALQADIFEAQGRHAEALAAFRAYKAVDDSLFNTESHGVIAELQAQYRANEQRQRIELLESNRRQQQLWVALLLGGVGVLFVIVAMQIGRMRLRRRALAAIEEAQEATEGKARELERANAQLQQANGKLQQANELKSRFLANISHEFRTPLTLTFGPLDDALEGRFGSFDEARPHFESARRNGGRLLRLINQLLDLSKLDAGALLLHTRSQDLAAHLQSLAALFESIAENRRITFTTHLPEVPLPHVYDGDKIEKVVINLLSNAFKFTEPGGKISLSLEPETDGTVCIEVADTGPGIAETHLSHLFDRFYQVESDTRRSHEGTGIGLALVKELVELHDGTITVNSREGFGTTFTIHLPPRVVSDASEIEEVTADVEEAEPVPGDGAAQSITGSLTIPADLLPALPPETPEQATVVLVVEDNADMRAYIRSHLDDVFVVIEAENGRAGVTQAVEAVPDLVLTDVMMPEMDGLELCAALKADERTSHIPVVLLTARAQVEHRIAGFESGADAYLPKPFNAEELRVRVQGLIAERRRLRRRFAGLAPTPEEAGATLEAKALPPREAAFVAKVEAIISERLDDMQFGVEPLAEELFLSRRQLFRKLGALTEETPASLIRRLRMERAAAMLKEGTYSVKEVAHAVGFRSHSSFTKAFQQGYGVPPSAYHDEEAGS